MKGLYRTAVLLAALALTLVSISGFSQTAILVTKPYIGNKEATNSTRPVSLPDSDPTYVVHRGDNLIKIARAHQTTVAVLKSANGLKGSKIKAGQTLIIPTSEIASSKKDTLRNSGVTASRNEEAAARHLSQLREQDLISNEDSSSPRLQLVEAGFKMIGIRYRRSGGSETTGFDCSGLVKNLFSKFNIELPRTSREQYKQGEKIDRDRLEPGDLVFFSSGGSNPTHVGVYVGNDKFLHAARKARKVIVSDLNKIWYTMRYLGARRVADLEENGTDSPPEKE
jgi:cell wall-associated NlpC family hydrolase